MTSANPDKAALFLLAPDFEDAKFPGQHFFCRHSALVEGVLTSFPALLDAIEVRRIAFPRPRAEVVELIGEANQALPVLVLPAGQSSACASGEANGRQFVSGAERIIDALVEDRLIPPPHP
ncbi:MAG: DUF3088 family protein [Mesorhizobium sp.]|uniref:DUF3088 family protein n=1 Tax=unclassified Mesorhizobium TaxID=325217 RepID=UPI000F75B3B7|nr:MULTISPECIES: DUF3088 family protein [unclassified Mesorhizobium]RVD73884.1 DUF3088 family protein [Mesorhizobium sp. M4A.F.Ca.ET.029.04.2.1]AZO48902.1 DUF3088 domain-containing protein [Mesorhizobium sp. M4B.F.Ca.ET.058.02.1.1]RVD44152.1 DUF3088 family protein [Mesorhizobium sp. M4A.F.Ca.ET.020.02.1.1]RWC09520.1 MAG: DUF3088 family protein [Mesorhizobium sp.]RWC52042.1 MAG: DUF3088 family protein [Mesorhizobium sp.]